MEEIRTGGGPRLTQRLGAQADTDRLTDALSGSRVLVIVSSVIGAPTQVRAVSERGQWKGILTDLLLWTSIRIPPGRILRPSFGRGQYPDGGQFGPAGSPSDSSSGAGLTPDRLTDALSGSRVLVSVFGGLRLLISQRTFLKEQLQAILTDLLLRWTSFCIPPGRYLDLFCREVAHRFFVWRVCKPTCCPALYPKLQLFFAKPGDCQLSSNVLLTLLRRKPGAVSNLLTSKTFAPGITTNPHNTTVVMIPKDAADNDIVSLSANLGSIPSVPTSVGADISLGDSGGQYPDGGQFGPAGSPPSEPHRAGRQGLTPESINDALADQECSLAVFGGLGEKSPTSSQRPF
ncbi:hypothetical protein HNY73_021565 [Argiope bruennichi]|uniref:Uncharacterized protein n=1 Tax=Argiope bruennichi TaxID=94029 RepID=A0A8T0DZY3_ARGBR|nr:hypothetical protein HNY73_021565 [Argiope bruennichi]